MKIYSKLVYDLKTGNMIEENSFEYDGTALECKGGSSTSTSVDEEYNKRMATIAEAQQAMAEEYYKYWETDFKPFEQEQIAAARGLLPQQTALARKYYGEIAKGPDVEGEMASARSDVQQAHSGMEGEFRREAGRMGVDPSSGRYAGMRSGMLRDKAKGLARAGTMGRRYAEEKHFERLKGAVGQ